MKTFLKDKLKLDSDFIEEDVGPAECGTKTKNMDASSAKLKDMHPMLARNKKQRATATATKNLVQRRYWGGFREFYI